MADRCTGHCCRAFVLRYAPEEVTRMRFAFFAADNAPGWCDDDGELRGFPEDAATILSMLVPLSGPTVTPPAGVDHPELETPHSWYTCRNLTPAGNCAIYERRPRMCSDYPYGNACQYRQCQWSRPRLELAQKQCMELEQQLDG